MKAIVCRFYLALLLACIGAISSNRIAWGEDEKSRPQNGGWTLEQAMQQLRWYPRDPYLQYVALQLARRENQQVTIAQGIERLTGQSDRRMRDDRARSATLFGIFSGALAVQESLQLDVMGGMRNAQPARPKEQAGNVPIATLSGPTIKSHPWKTMLAGRAPEVSRLANYVPEDFYYVEFRSVSKLLEVMDVGDLWGTHLFGQTVQEARSHLANERLMRQLAVESNDLLRPIYDTVVEEAAVAGSDLFLRAGSDVTLIFRARQPQLFRRHMDSFLSNVESNAKAIRTEGQHGGVPFVHLSTPDRGVHVFSAYPAADLHVRGNSKVAFERVLDLIAGAQQDSALGQTDEFRYIRTLLKHGAQDEDGLVYLSDPFIRRLVGPELRLTERRRMLCYNHLRMIGHAAAMYQTEHGRRAGKLDDLRDARCLPDSFGEGDLRCACGGRYSLDADGATGVCSFHGHSHALRPCIEIPVETVTAEEAEIYRAFLNEYNQYWRTFFDPIAVRIKLEPKRYRLETIVLPLIDNSIYTGLARGLGGEPQPLDAIPIPKNNIFTVAFKLNKRQLLEDAGVRPNGDLFGIFALTGRKMDEGLVHDFLARGLSDQVALHVCDNDPLFDFSLAETLGQMVGSFTGGRRGFNDDFFGIALVVASLNSPVYLSLPLADNTIADAFLKHIDTHLAELARMPEGFGFFRVERDFYTLPLANNVLARSVGLQFGPIKWRFFWARIGEVLYIASKPAILEELAATKQASPARATNPDQRAHALLRIRPEHWKQVLPNYRLGWAERHRQACLNNIGPLTSAQRSILITGPGKPGDEIFAETTTLASRLYDCHFYCPEGGRYCIGADGKSVACSIHGAAAAPTQLAVPPHNGSIDRMLHDFSGLSVALTFLEDGLHAVLTIERKEK